MPRLAHCITVPALLILALALVVPRASSQHVGVWIEGGPSGTGSYQNAFGVTMKSGSDVHVGVGVQVGRIVATARAATLGRSFESEGSIFREYEAVGYDSFEGSLMLGYAFPVTERVQLVPLAGYVARQEEMRLYDSFCLFCAREDADTIEGRSLHGATVGLDAQVRIIRVLGLTTGVRASLIPSEPLVQGHVGLRFGWLR